MAAPKRISKQTHLGTHIIAELFGCKKLDDLKFVAQSLKEAARICGASILHTKFHRFSPHGITGYILLAESHISIHTWPECGYAAVDVFTCGLMDTEKAVQYLVEKFAAQKVNTRRIERGNREDVL
ncbi:MAG: adenosylmethionine decarboxylase [Candidatus Wildermuthbacteria bacterium]|nr:adenosylmethionine decarboxylase [Candidatus Wildermuthbacteria bacterium]